MHFSISYIENKLFTFIFYRSKLFCIFFRRCKMVHKFSRIQSRLDSYRVAMDTDNEPLDTSVSSTESMTSVVVLAILGSLIFLNVFFYILYRRMKTKLKIGDVTIDIKTPKRTLSEENLKHGKYIYRSKSSSEIELRSIEGFSKPERSQSEADMMNMF